jgi:hypothetical protein
MLANNISGAHNKGIWKPKFLKKNLLMAALSKCFPNQIKYEENELIGIY